MPNFLYDTSGDFSGLTPKLIGFQSALPIANSRNDISTARTMTFTFGTSGYCDGMFFYTYYSSQMTNGASGFISALLQESTGTSWTTRGGVSVRISNLYRGHAVDGGDDSNYICGYYYQFPVGVSVNTVTNSWRSNISTSETIAQLHYNSTGAKDCVAFALTQGTSYTPGVSNDIWFKQGLSITLDQGITAQNIFVGQSTYLTWKNPPSSTFPIRAGALSLSQDCGFIIGSSDARIPASKKAVLQVPFSAGVVTNGQNHQTFQFYGEIPVNPVSFLTKTAGVSQKYLNIADDFSSDWGASDYLFPLGEQSENGYVTSIMIASVSGKTILGLSNLLYNGLSGTAVLNGKKVNDCGIRFVNTNVFMNPRVFEMSGCFLPISSNTVGSNVAFYGSSFTKPPVIDNVYIGTTSLQASFNVYYSNFNNNRSYSVLAGGYFNNIYYIPPSSTESISQIININNSGAIMSNMYFPSSGGGALLTLSGSTLSNINISAGASVGTNVRGSLASVLSECNVTDLRLRSTHEPNANALYASSFTSSTMKNVTLMNGGNGLEIFGDFVKAKMQNVTMVGCSNDVDVNLGVVVDAEVEDSNFGMTTNMMQNASVSSTFSVFGVSVLDKTYKPTGMYEKQSSVFKNKKYALRFTPIDASNPITAFTTIPVNANQTTVIASQFRKEVSYGSSYLPYMKLSGMGMTETTVRMADVNDTWVGVTLSALPLQSGFATLEIGGQGNGVSNRFYVDDTIIAPSELDTGRYESLYRGKLPPMILGTSLPARGNWYDDPYVVDNEATALAFTGISIDGSGNITITENHSIVQVYEYIKAYSRNLSMPNQYFVTYDGITYYAYGDFTVNGVTLSGSGLKLNLRTHTFYALGGGGTSAIVTDVNGTLVALTLENIVPNSRCLIYPNTGGTQYMNQIAGSTIVSMNFQHTVNVPITVRVRKSSAPIKYLPFETTGTITSSGYDTTVNQVVDPIAN